MRRRVYRIAAVAALLLSISFVAASALTYTPPTVTDANVQADADVGDGPVTVISSGDTPTSRGTCSR